ncbi:DUF5131 family protein [Domibacillus enclensis]|uniref:Protein gp37 n=1 Tax=Domibacillus enclensis TaxID=1017273 RepID=A0A1N6WE36_9BACI|nr:phage Gp37/Gp68 family protein [Domibacillus enclensis]OXS77912.1 hypothetical protein B1B05_09910 [Domibacillus enclensis]SIQ88246.1 protein gp37 [Domibacillus enclensis]
MAGNSSIEWTEATWNPVTGCTKVSEGCKHCYAERMAKRLTAMGNPRYENGFNVTLHPDLIDTPRKWTKPRKIFVNSMSDLFHKDVPLNFIQQVFQTMNETPQHSYQVLTKRPERAAELSPYLNFTPNIWMGTSIENQRVIERMEYLKQVPAEIRFLSCEPLLGPLDLELSKIHWVIVGGESGPGARPMEADWVRSIRDQCQEQLVAFFFKQWGGVQKHRFGRELDEQTYDEYPELTMV